MAMSVPIYLVVKGSGQFDENDIEYTLIVDVKLTRACAEAVASTINGATVRKMVADKETPLMAY